MRVDGGYGLLIDGLLIDGLRNIVGHAVTFASTSPSLRMLEKLVPLGDPKLMMVRFSFPGDLAIERTDLGELSPSSRRTRC